MDPNIPRGWLLQGARKASRVARVLVVSSLRQELHRSQAGLAYGEQ